MVKLQRKKKKNNQALGLNRYFSKKDILITNRLMKSYSSSLINREMQMKTTIRYHFTPVEVAVTKKDKR